VVHGLHHHCQHRIDQASDLFRIALLYQRRGIGDIGEKRGDQLPLAGCRRADTGRGLLGQDPFYQMLRGIVDRRRRPGGRMALANRQATGIAETGAPA
jgi:hypothetical protein